MMGTNKKSKMSSSPITATATTLSSSSSSSTSNQKLRVLVLLNASFECAKQHFGGYSEGLLRNAIQTSVQNCPQLFQQYCEKKEELHNEKEEEEEEVCTKSQSTCLIPDLLLRQKELIEFIEINVSEFGNNFQAAARALPKSIQDLREMNIDAIIGSGAGANVTDRLPCFDAEMQFLRFAIPSGIPILGICFTHQAIAACLPGGKVNWEINQVGNFSVALREENCVEDEIFGPIFQSCCCCSSSSSSAARPTFLDVVSIHHQSVKQIPQGAKVLGTTQKDGAQILKYSESAWSVQFHPEYYDSKQSFLEKRFDAEFAKETNKDCSISAGIIPLFLLFAQSRKKKKKIALKVE